MRKKIIGWLKRYWPAEIVAFICALTGGIVVHNIFNNAILSAFAATWGDNIGYYGTIIFRDLRVIQKIHKKISAPAVVKVFRNLFLEFGSAEFLDSFVIRPFAMYIFPILFNNLSLGLIVGKIVADIVFYIPTIVSYELKGKFLKD